MTTVQALIAITIAGEGPFTSEELDEALPGLEARARKALKEIGTTNAEMNMEFPQESLYEGIDLAMNNPEEFRRQARFAMQQIIGNN